MKFQKGNHPVTEIKKGQHLSPKTEFKKGHLPWCTGMTGLKGYWTGKKRPPETGLKISLAKIGKRNSEEQNRKISIALKKNPPWKGKKFSKKHRKNLSKAHKGQISFRKGKKSPETFGNKNGNWNGGTYTDFYGYKWISSPNHPFKDKRGYVREHRLIMEKHLGRYLTRKEIIHHINYNPSDNRLENLMLFPNQMAHAKYHFMHSVKKGRQFSCSC